MTPEEMKLDMLVAKLDYENRLLRARNERLEKEAEQRSQQQEPVANIRTWRKNGELHAELWNWDRGIESLPDGEHDLYTHPQAHEWVGLTDNEVLDMARTFGAQPWPPGSCVALGQMIEAKLREKNQ